PGWMMENRLFLHWRRFPLTALVRIAYMTSMNATRTTTPTGAVRLPDSVLRRSRAVAAIQGKRVHAWITEILEAHLAKSSAPLEELASHAPRGGSPET